MSFILRSSDFVDQQTMPKDFVYDGMGAGGANRSPELSWEGAPPDTRSFALTVFDPDAPTGAGWWHWVVYNMPAHTRSLPRGAGAAGGAKLPPGARQGRTDFGDQAYGGPAPPPGHGPHRYVFTLHALNVDHLDVPDDAAPAAINALIRPASIGQARLTALYER